MAQLIIVDPKGGEEPVSIGEGGEYVIGRDPGLAVTLADRKVSRRHARVFAQRGEYYIEDLGSANGVLIGGSPIGKPTRLVTGVEVVISTYKIRFLGDDAAAEGGAPTFSLIGLTAPVSNQTFILPQGDLDVGRGEQNAVVIADPSLSRKHAVLQVTASGVVVEDMESSNGTFVNGVRVGRRALAHGDRVRFGNVELEVASSAGPAAKRLLGLSLADRSVQLAVGMGVIAILLLAVTVAIVIRRSAGGGAAASGGAHMSSEETYEQQILASLTNAAEQMRRQSWDDALRIYGEVLERDPINPEARKGATDAESNRDHALKIDAAKKLVAGKPDEAVRLLATIPKNAFFGPTAAALLDQARAAIAARTLNEARSLCQQKNYKACHDTAVTHLEAKPDSSDGRALVGEAEAALRQQKIAFVPWLPPG
jgi:pSer/pThr/pTyr-binding forkhead associated (FHA) protein